MIFPRRCDPPTIANKWHVSASTALSQLTSVGAAPRPARAAAARWAGRGRGRVQRACLPTRPGPGGCHVSRVSCRHVSPLQDDVHVLPRDAAPGPGRGGRAADPGGGAGGGQVQTPGVCVATGIIYLLFAVTS